MEIKYMDTMDRIKTIGKRLKEEYYAEEVILFGSYAKDKATKDSDIDIFIIAPTQERFFERMATVRKLTRDLCYKFPLEPIVLTRSETNERLQRGDQFVKQIIDDGIRL
ncbi:nucleotidyltransferase domain-containing protein [Candidatus Poribacteria bacterium]|nr:nucleotidyltransferase domain-containing protein [Candidatus Poribacteria bacterium]